MRTGVQIFITQVKNHNPVYSGTCVEHPYRVDGDRRTLRAHLPTKVAKE